MIYLYSGTPGSGKSLHVARDIYNRLNFNKKYPSVIANFTINKKMIKNKKAKFIYLDNSELTVEYLVDYAMQHHTLGIENQTLVVVDECQVIWNTREWQSNKKRMDWIKFFTQHRKLGYNFICIAQNDRMIDKQIRSLFEYEITHRKVNNYKIGKLLPLSTFIAISRWYGINEKLESNFFIYTKKWGKFYDSYGTFQLDNKINSIANGEGVLCGVPSPSQGVNLEKLEKENKLNKSANIKNIILEMKGYIAISLLILISLIIYL